MTARPTRFARWPVAETVLAVSVVAGLVASWLDFRANHRLPQPFYFGLNESLTDWFVTAMYAHQSGAYDPFLFSSIYPPVSFLFLRLTTLPGCYLQDAYYARECDTLAQVVIVVSYVCAAAIAWLSFRGNDRRTSAMRGVAFAIGFPLLFALERGNTIMVAFVCFVAGYGGVCRTRWGQALGAALALNFKPYLLAPAAADALKRHWRFLELTVLFTMLVYAVTYAAWGEGDPFTLVANIANFSEATISFIWERIYYATSLESFTFFNSYRFPTRDFIDGRILETAYILIYVIMYSAVASIFVSLAAAWANPAAVPRLRLMFFLLALHLVTAAEGGYLFMFVNYMIFMERAKGRLVMAAVVIAYLQSLPYDLVLAHFVTLRGNVWLSGYDTEVSIGPAVGMFLRPLLLDVTVWLLAADTILTVTRGWRTTAPLLGLARSRPVAL